MCLPDAIVQHERAAVRRVRGSDCWHSRRYVAMAGKAEQQGGFGMEPLCSIGSGRRKLHRRRLQWACPDSERLAQAADVIARNQLMAVVRTATVEVEPRLHSTILLHVSTQLLEKACCRRSLSRSVRIFTHPEDQQCRLPCPGAVTPRAMDSFATPSTWS